MNRAQRRPFHNILRKTSSERVISNAINSPRRIDAMPLEKGSSQATNSKNSATAGATFCLMPSGHGEDDAPATRKKGRGQSRHHDHGGTGTGRAGGYVEFLAAALNFERP